MSWRRVWPNLAKSNEMESTSWTAIGSSMRESGLRASCARTANVSNAVSETPVSVASTFTWPAPCRWSAGCGSWSMTCTSSCPWSCRSCCPACHSCAPASRRRRRRARSALPSPRPPRAGQFVEDVGRGDERDVGVVAVDLALEGVRRRDRRHRAAVVGQHPGVVAERSRNAVSAAARTCFAVDVLVSRTLPLASTVATSVNPASVRATTTSAILRLTPTLTPRRKAA